MRAGVWRATARPVAVLLLVLGTMAFSLSAGLSGYGPAVVWQAMTAFDGSQAHHVIRDLRLPRAVIAPVVGASLGVAGVLIQTLIRNRIASPDILGLNAGAALAVVACLTLFGMTALPALAAAAAAGATATAAVVYAVVTASGAAMSPARTVLAGITLAGLLTALVQVILTTEEAALDQLLFWLAGAFVGRSLDLLSASGWLFLTGALLALAVTRPLDALAADEATAQSVGVPVARVRLMTFAAVALLTGGAVAVAGPVGFIGLVVPHLARRLAPRGHREQVVMAALLGALYALVADIGARYVVYPAEAPVGAVTALIGGPVLLALLRRRAA